MSSGPGTPLGLDAGLLMLLLLLPILSVGLALGWRALDRRAVGPPARAIAPVAAVLALAGAGLVRSDLTRHGLGAGHNEAVGAFALFLAAALALSLPLRRVLARQSTDTG